MPPIKNRVGERYGKLIVVKMLIEPTRTNNGGMWESRCDCGEAITTNGRSFYDRKSCGCLVRENNRKIQHNRRAFDRVTISTSYLVHKGNATQRGLKPLLKEDWLLISMQPCFYCGETDTRNAAKMKSYISSRGVSLSPGEEEKYAVQLNGVDRVDSKLGYELSNCVPCCGMCNRMKNNFTHDVFLTKVKLIASRF